MSQQINLYNPIFRRQKQHFSARAMVQALAVLVVGALAIYAFEVRQNRVLTTVLAETDRQIVERREHLTRFAREFSQKGSSRALADELARTETRLQERERLLADIQTGVGGDVQGYARYLRALAQQAVPGVWIVGVGIGGRSGDLVIRGRALTASLVPVYIAALSKEAPLAGRRVGELQIAAREAPAPAAAAPGQPVAPRPPEQYIEFTFAIPLGAES